MVVFTTATALVPPVSVIEDGLDATVRSFIVMTYTTVLGTDSAWALTFASARRDFL